MPAILDIEASGFGKGSYPIEIGVAADDGEQFSWLVYPQDDWVHWQPDAEALHKIPRSKLLESGLPVRDIAKQMNARFEGQTLYSDGWGFDSGWLNLLFYYANQSMHFRLETLPKILTEYQFEHWDKIKNHLRTKHNLLHHRAAEDAKLIQLTYQRTALDEQLTQG